MTRPSLDRLWAQGRVGDLLAALALTLAVVVLNVLPQVTVIEDGGIAILSHARFAQDLLETGVFFPGHFLYHLAVAVAHVFMPVSWLQAHVVVIVLTRIWLALILFRLVRASLLPMDEGQARCIAVAVAVAQTFASSVSFFTWGASNYYLGYLVPNLYHNPTYVIMQPLALLVFYAVLRVVTDPSKGFGLEGAGWLAILSVLSVLAKPNMMIALIPAAGCYVLLRGLLGNSRIIATLAVGMVLPSLAVMAWQYTSTVLAVQGLEQGEGSGFRIAPFYVMGILSEVGLPGAPGWVLLPKFVGAVLFPAAVALVYRRAAWRDPRMVLAWLLFAFGAAFAYLLAEHPRPNPGNFVWSGHIALFVLMVVSTLFFIEQGSAQGGWGVRRLIATPGRALCVVLFVLHVVAGVGPFLWPSR